MRNLSRVTHHFFFFLLIRTIFPSLFFARQRIVIRLISSTDSEKILQQIFPGTDDFWNTSVSGEKISQIIARDYFLRNYPSRMKNCKKFIIINNRNTIKSKKKKYFNREKKERKR